MAIPRSLHFCWIGPNLPWAYGFALLSAAVRGGADEVILHHTDELEDGPVLNALRAVSIIRLVRIEPQTLLIQVGDRLGLGNKLWTIYAGITSPAILSDILRASILYNVGGIYLDVDTITVASLTPLLDQRQFIGVEWIVWPYWIKASRSSVVWMRTLALDILRKAARLMPEGWRIYRHVESLYYKGINGAIMGGEAGAPLFETYLRHMTLMPTNEQGRPNALGPDLLQRLIAENLINDLIIYDPKYFYPLAPEISEHWFRTCHNAPQALGKVLSPETVIAHWYGSVRSRPYVAVINPEYISRHKHTQLYSALVAEVLPELLPPTSDTLS